MRVVIAGQPDDGDELPRARGPFSDIQTHSRKVSHTPVEPLGPFNYHSNSAGGRWAHAHEIPEDGPFDLKQAIGEHIDTWHTPPYGEEKHYASEE